MEDKDNTSAEIRPAAKKILNISGITFTRMELLQGFMTIFILLLVFILGQETTWSMIQGIQSICPAIQVTSASPITGVTIEIINFTKLS